jgi:ABC-type multidrug transport system ATPase subunit
LQKKEGVKRGNYMSDDILIELKNVSKKYIKQTALSECNLSIKKGRIYGVVGPNGAGKTTMFKCMLGISYPTGGSITYGEDNNIRNTKLKFGALIEKPYLNPNMTALQNLNYMIILCGMKNRKDIVNELIKSIGLENVKNKKVKRYSMGMKQRLGIAMAVVNAPDVLFLDEPMNGLDPEGIIDVRNYLKNIFYSKERTIIISSHILGELDKLVTDYIFIKNGRILLNCEKTDIKQVMDEKEYTNIEDFYMNIIKR